MHFTNGNQPQKKIDFYFLLESLVYQPTKSNELLL